MSANIKLEADGTCNLCKKVSAPNEHSVSYAKVTSMQYVRKLTMMTK